MNARALGLYRRTCARAAKAGIGQRRHVHHHRGRDRGGPTLFEKRRRIVLESSMMAINGRIQREGKVVHLVAQQLFDWCQAIWPLWLIVTNSSSERRRGQRVRALLTKPTPRLGVRLFDALRAKDVRVVGSSPFKAATCYRSKLYCRQAICTTHGIPAGGLWLVEVARREHVEQLVLDDPFWPTGLRRDVRILAWHRVFADSMRLKAQG
ncbi:UNVERIFIED_ORG: hypothetical protein M2435_005488 [Rhizobium sophorae]|nr:hypothetical protein [Rhizobium sophorae]